VRHFYHHQIQFILYLLQHIWYFNNTSSNLIEGFPVYSIPALFTVTAVIAPPDVVADTNCTLPGLLWTFVCFWRFLIWCFTLFDLSCFYGCTTIWNCAAIDLNNLEFFIIWPKSLFVKDVRGGIYLSAAAEIIFSSIAALSPAAW
jgi:hypothetical protein